MKQTNNNEQTNPKDTRHFKTLRDFLHSRSGKYFLFFLELVILVAFFLQPDLYYDGTALHFLDRFYADSLTLIPGLWIVLVFLTFKDFQFKPKTDRILHLVLGITAPIIAFLLLEQYNHMQFWNPIFTIPISYFLLNLAIYYVIYAVLILIFNSVRGAAASLIFLTSFFGIFNYELTGFRGMSFIASDIYSVLTAISVANTYRVQIDVDTAVYFMTSLVIITAILKLLDRKKLFHARGRLIYTAACAALCAAFVKIYVLSSFLGDIGVDFRVYRPQYKYRFYGTMLTTVRTFGYLHVEEPEDYSKEAVQQIIDQYQAEDTTSEETAKKGHTKERPNIIVVMNESFADVGHLGHAKLNADNMPFFRSLTRNTIKGYAYSSVFGGNTANSEFEFLTGNTMAFMPDNSVPYQLFLRDEVDGLTADLKDQGYSPCYALHPFYETGYSRYKIYPLMGFDRFFTSDDFSVFTDTVNHHITDEEDYRKIIELYENRDDRKPFYLFNVTMQNHGSYDGNLYETGDSIKLKGSLGWSSKARQYLNMIKMSDDALKYLVNYFQKEDDPTIIVFFGDHQPDLDEEFYHSLLGKSLDSLEGEELEQLYKVPFLIWTNYKIDAKRVRRTSFNYLSTYLSEISGIKTTGYQDFLTKLRQKIPCINALGYWGDDGKYYDLKDETSPYREYLRQYQLLQYNDIFGKEDEIRSFFTIQNE